LPGAVVGVLAGVEQFAGESVVVGEQPGRHMAERDHAGAGERGDIHHAVWIETLDVGQGVAEDQAALGVGVEDFHGLPGHRFDDVAGLGGTAAGHVLGGGNHSDEI